MKFIIIRTSDEYPYTETHTPTFTELKKKIEEMEKATEHLLQVTKELREILSISWIK